MPTYAVNYVSIPCVNNLRQQKIIIDAAMWGRTYRPQPFADALISRFEGSIVTLPEGYIGHSYNHYWLFLSDPTITLESGTIPPGLVLTTPNIFEYSITGTPTTLGTYNFSMKVTTANTFGFINLQITILPDPDEGIGSSGGG